jgi:hypothetical protein
LKLVTVGILSGIGNELVVERQYAPFVEVIDIESLEDFLVPVVQLAITDHQADVTRSEEVTMRAGETVDHASNFDCVIRPAFGLRQTRKDGKSESDDLPRGADVPLVETAGK